MLNGISAFLVSRMLFVEQLESKIAFLYRYLKDIYLNTQESFCLSSKLPLTTRRS